MTRDIGSVASGEYFWYSSQLGHGLGIPERATGQIAPVKAI